MQIRPFTRHDYEAWLPLWLENCAHKISDEVTQETWRRLCHPKEQVFGLGAFADDKPQNLQGLLHYILHPTTGQIEPVCYMQDVFVAHDSRRIGIAKRLIWTLGEIGKQNDWARIYWMAEKDNMAAQSLYKNLGIAIDFSLHILPTKDITT